MRDFEKISFEQFKKDVNENEKLYNKIKIPQRDSEMLQQDMIYIY